jgi:hypothetical protein
MQVDCAAYGHDLAILKASATADRTNLPWHKSEAKKLLKQDIDDGKNRDMKPSELRGTRKEYEEFTLEVFRKHIHQDVDGRSKRAYRFAKKKKKKGSAVIQIDREAIASLRNQL